jgi:hypothetical protein
MFCNGPRARALTEKLEQYVWHMSDGLPGAETLLRARNVQRQMETGSHSRNHAVCWFLRVCTWIYACGIVTCASSDEGIKFVSQRKNK